MAEITRRQLVGRLGAGASLLAIPALLAACGKSGGTNAGGEVGGRGTDAEIPLVLWAVGAALPSLDIATGFLLEAVQVQRLALEGLVTLTPDLQVAPGLAESWSQPDPMRYVYQIRSGVNFWDGSPLTAEDVAFSLNRNIDPKVGSQIAGYYGNVRSVEVTGPSEVTVHMKSPDPLFQYVPVFSWILSKAYVQRLGRKLGTSGPKVTIMGTGPYRVLSFNSSTGVKLERNEAYWGTKPLVRRIDMKIITDPQAARLAMQSGDIEGHFAVPVNGLREWERLPNVNVQSPPGLTVSYLSFDVESPPFDDVHVRRAFAHALDGEGIVKAFLGDAGQPANAVVAPAQWANLASESEVRAIYDQIPTYEYDLDKAKAELAQSAHPNGFEATIEFNSSQPEFGKALVSLSQALKKIGVTLKVKSVPESKWIADIYGHREQLVSLTLLPDYPDPANNPVIIFPSANAMANNLNTANFRNPQVDRLLKQQAATTDRAERARLIGEVLRIAGEELPYLPFWWETSPAAVNRKYVLNDFTPLWYYQDWAAGLHAASA